MPRAALQAAQGMAALAAEVATLKAAAEAERARLDAYQQAQDSLTAMLDGLRHEIALLERRRDDFHAELDELEQRATASCAATPEAQPRKPGGAPRQLVSAAGATGWNGPAAGRVAEPGRTGHGEPAQQAVTPAPGVVIHHRAGSALARRAAELVAEEVRKADLGPVLLQPERNLPSVRTVRYAGDEASSIGERLAARFRARWHHPWTVELSTHGRDAGEPRPVLEIWLPH